VADPVAVAVLQRDRLGLADRRRDRLPRLARDLDLLQQLLIGELLEERRLAAPEDVHLRLALPFDDAAVRDRRGRRGIALTFTAQRSTFPSRTRRRPSGAASWMNFDTGVMRFQLAPRSAPASARARRSPAVIATRRARVSHHSSGPSSRSSHRAPGARHFVCTGRICGPLARSPHRVCMTRSIHSSNRTSDASAHVLGVPKDCVGATAGASTRLALPAT